MTEEKKQIIDKYSRNIVTKSNNLTGMYYKLNLISQKLILTFISLINSRERQVNDFYRVSLKEMVYLLGIENSNSCKSEIISAIMRLQEKNMIYLGNNEWSNWISSVKFTLDGFVEFEFSKRIIPHLFQLREKFTSYKLGNVQPMKTVKSIRIYELLKMNEKRQNFRIEVEQLKKLLDIEPNAYKNFKDFRIKVLEAAREEIKLFTELSFEWEAIKEQGSKKIIALNIFIHAKDIPFESWKETMEKVKAAKARELKKEYEIPTSETATPAFIAVYKNFIDNLQNFPENYTFENYVKDNSFKIIYRGKIKDIIYNQTELPFIP